MKRVAAMSSSVSDVCTPFSVPLIPNTREPVAPDIQFGGQLMLVYQEMTSGPAKETAMAAIPKNVPKGSS
jgi:hypothetical protein